MGRTRRRLYLPWVFLDRGPWLTMQTMSIIAVPTRFRRAIDIGFVVMVILGLIVAVVHDFTN